MTERLYIGPPHRWDEAFIYDSWLRSWHEQSARKTPYDIWQVWGRRDVDAVFKRKPLILTARSQANDAVVVGWLVATVTPELFGLEWAYTKARPGNRRKRGVFMGLLARALEIAGPQVALHFTRDSMITPRLQSMGFTRKKV